jgi:hypothetical protein
MARKLRKTIKPGLPAPVLRVQPDAWPAYGAEPWPVAQLVPYARNARTHSDRQVREIAGLIARFGWTAPILVDEANMIIAGHGRVLAAQLLGIAEVPVIVARDWSEADKRAYVIADNKVAENAGWDKELLAIELAALANMPDFDATLGDLGFSDAELTRLLPAQERDGHTDPDAAGEAGGEVVSRPGDIWLLGEHRLMCGDSTNPDHVAALLGLNKPHLMVSDPPYGVEYDPAWRGEMIADGTKRATGEVANDSRADWREAWALFPGDVAYIWHASLFGPEVCASLEACGFERRYQIIWNKAAHTIGRGDYHWQHEPCWYMVRKGAHRALARLALGDDVWDIEHAKAIPATARKSRSSA